MYDSLCYTKSFLDKVIVRTDFLTPATSLEHTLPPKLANSLTKNFPIAEPGELVAQEVVIDQSNEPSFTKKKSKQWVFYDKNRDKQLVLTSQSVSITYSKYSNYEATKHDFSLVLDELKRTFPELRGERFGLRYINQIDAENSSQPTIWDEFIASELITARSFFDSDDDPLTRLISIVELKYPDLAVRFQFGMPNQDYPAIIRRSLFVLDFDAYIQTAYDLTEALTYMDRAHEHIQRLFEKSITQALREKMNVRTNHVQD